MQGNNQKLDVIIKELQLGGREHCYSPTTAAFVLNIKQPRNRRQMPSILDGLCRQYGFGDCSLDT